MLSGKTILVTGAGSGIGRATALAAAVAGASVCVADLNETAAGDTADMINRVGGKAFAICVDISRERDVRDMVQATVKTFGRLDGAFNNAGVAQKATDTVHCPEEVFDRLMAVNAKGVWYCLKQEIQVMLTQGGGAIVTNASLAGVRANPFTPAYIASKHAAVALSQGAAIEYGRKNIRVNCVCPGLIHTPMMHGFLDSISASPETADTLALPGRWGTPEEVGATVIWLLSDASSLINGVTLPVDGGKLAA
jgi:NAD(P)-dependent dehydrogenase (short-subunit alcohol dehydrogenase family)